MSDDSDPPPSEPEPTRALLLAQALETCIQAERKVPGSADQIVARRPAWMRAELRRLLALANALDAAATNAVMSDEFRAAARARLMRRIAATAPRAGAVDPSYADISPASRAADEPTGPLPTLAAAPTNASSIVDASRGPLAPSAKGTHAGAHPATAATTSTGRRRRSRWLWRGAMGGILAAILAALATLSASASSLPGQPLYGIKQATEEIGVRFAPDDQARTLMLLRQANARLDETAQLLDQGRTDAVADSAQRYDDALDRATSTYVVTIADAPAAEDASTTAELEAELSQQHAQLQTLLASAPQLARAELSQALVATERSRALVAAPKPSELVAETEPSTSAAAAVTGATNAVTAANTRAASTRATDSTDRPPDNPDHRTAPPATTMSALTQAASSSKPAAAPPPVDLVAPRSDITPYVPLTASHVSGGDSDAQAEDVDALHAAPADSGTAHPDADVATVNSGRTPPDGSRGRRDSQRVERLQIPALAPPPAVAQARSTSGASDGDDNAASAADDRPPVDARGTAGHADPSASALSGPSAAADNADDGHVMTPSPNQNDTRGRVAVQVTPPPAARQASNADADDRQAGGPGPALSAQSGGAASQNASAEAPSGVRATRELAADQRSNATPATSVVATPATSARAGADTSTQGGAAAITRDRAAGNAAGSTPSNGGNPGNGSPGNSSADNSNTPANTARPGGAWSSAGGPPNGTDTQPSGANVSASGSSANSSAAPRGAPNPSSGTSPSGTSPTGNGSSASSSSNANGGRANGPGGQPTGGGSSANGGGSQPGSSAGSSTGPSGTRR